MQSAMSNGGITSPLNNILRRTINPWYDDNPNPIAGSSWPQYLKNAMVVTPPRTHTTPAGGLSGGTPIVIMPKNGGTVLIPTTLMVGPANASASSPNIRIGYAGNSSFEMTNGGSHVCYFGNAGGYGTRVGGAAQFTAHSGGYFGFASTGGGTSLGTAETCIFRSASATIGVYNPTSTTTAQTFELYNTWSSTTSFENLRFKSTTSSAYQIGSAIGSAGGTNRDISLGRWDSAGTFTNQLYITASGNAGINPGSVGYLRDIFQVNTTSTSTTFGSANIAPQGITITNSTNQINRPVGLQFSGYEGWGFGGIYGTMTSNGGNTYGRISIVLRSASGGSYTEVCRWDENSCFSLTPWVSTSGSITGFVYTDAANTGQTASTEATSVNFNLSSTKQFATGALTTQRAFRVQAPTYSFVGASTITTASTLSISGAPVAGTNATITNSYALNVESGKTQFSGWTQVGGTDSWNTPLSVGNRVQMWASGYNCLIMNFGAGSQLNYHASWGVNGLQLQNRSAGFGWSSLSNNFTNFDAALYSPSAHIIEQRIGTNAQTFRLYNTYTSSTSGEYGELRWASNVLYIGSNKGSAGGSARDIAITHGGTVVANFLSNRFYLGPIVDSTTTGGNARGQYAVDLQLVREAANQVASGSSSVTIGYANRASGTNSIAIGTYCVSSGIRSVAIGNACTASGISTFATGASSTCSSSESGFAAGYYVNVSGSYGAAGFGISTIVSGQSAFGCGTQAEATRYSQYAHASGAFASQGDAQFVRFILRRKTTDATPTTLMLDGSSTRLTIPSGKTMSCKVTVKGIKSDGSAKAKFVRLVEITNVSGTTSLDTSPDTLGIDYNPSGCACDITADNTNDALQINVTGITGETWRWVAVIEGLEIAYGA